MHIYIYIYLINGYTILLTAYDCVYMLFYTILLTAYEYNNQTAYDCLSAGSQGKTYAYVSY